MADEGDILQGQGAVVIDGNDAPLAESVKRAQARLAAFGTYLASFDKKMAAAGDFAKRVGSQVSSAGRELVKVAGLTALPLGFSTRTFMGFEDQMMAVKAVTGAVGKEFELLYDKAKELGRTTSFTAGEVGAGMLSLARSGFSPKEIDASIQGMLDLARATGTDLAMSADIAAGTLRAFNLQAEEMPRVADVLVATANNSAQTLEDLGESMKYVAPIAQEYGLSLEQTSKALGVLANMSIKGTMAGTSLRQIMLQLSDPAIQQELRAIGVQALDSTGNLRDVGDLLIDVGKAMAGMTNAQRLALGKTLFDQRAAGAALKLAKTTFPQLEQAIDKAGGTARRTADVMDSGLGGAFRMMTSGIEGVQIALGEALAPVLIQIGRSIADISVEVARWVKQNAKLVVSVTAAVVAAAGIGAALVATGVALKVAVVVVSAFAGAWSAAMAIVSAASLGTVLPIAGIVAAVGLMAYSIVKHTETGKAAFESVKGVVGSVVNAISGRLDGARAAVAWLVEGFQNLKAEVITTVTAMGQALATGDIAAAAKVLWALLRLEWTKGTSALKEIWAGVKTFVLDTWSAVVYRLAEFALNAWATMQSAWHSTVSFMTDLWTTFAGTAQKVWGTVQNALTKQWIKFLGLFDSSIDVEAAMKLADQDYEREKAKINADMNDAYNRSRQTADANKARIEKERQAAQAMLKDQEAADWQARHAKYDADIQAAQDAAAAAKREWEEAIKGKPAAAADNPFSKTDKSNSDPNGQAQQAAKAAEDTAQKAPAASMAGTAVVGSFNLAAAFGLAAGGGVQDRIAAATEETAKNTRNLGEDETFR